MSENFIQYCYTTNSLAEGFGDIKGIVSKAKDLNLKSLVLADVGTTSAYVKFYKECKSKGIKPILGLTASVHDPVVDFLYFKENNEVIFDDLKNIIGFDFSDKNILKLSDREISKISESLFSLRVYSPPKGKTKARYFKPLIEDFVSSIGLDKNDEDLTSWGVWSEWIKDLQSTKLPRQGYIKLLSHNDKGVVEINDLLTEAYKNGQDHRYIEVDSKGEKSKREDFFHPLIHIDNISNQKNITASLVTDFNDFLFRFENSSYKNRVISIIKEKLPNIKVGIDYQTYDISEIEKQDKHNKILNSAINMSGDVDFDYYATHVSRFTDKDDYDIYDFKASAMIEELYYSPSRTRLGALSQYIYSYSDFTGKYRSFPSYLIDNSKTLADSCNSEMIIGENYLPSAPIPDDYSIGVLRDVFDELSIKYLDTDKYDDFEKKYKEYRLTKDDFSGKSDLKIELEIQRDFSNLTAQPYLRERGWQGVERLLKENHPDSWQSKIEDYRERFNMECDIICDMGFAGYFLIVHDFIRWAKENNIPVGPGRGSGAGSIMAYGLEITVPDPIEFDLVFERFLNPERVSMPDFDIDFCTNRRSEVIQYVMDKYGNDGVSYISTESKFKAKMAARLYLKSYGFTQKQADLVSGVISDDPSYKIKDINEDDEIQELISKAPAMKEVFKRILKSDNETSNYGVHAGGVVMSPTGKLSHFSTVLRNPDGTAISTAYDKDDIEDAGLVKFDFLGLSNLTIINDAVIFIKENYGIDIDIDKISLDDEKTYKLLQSAQTQEIFQLGSSGMKELVKKLQVKNIEDISALVALYRPGPMQSGMLDSYVNRKNGVEEVSYLHPKAEDITKNTYGTVIYQEQVMKIAQEVAGYTLGGADLLRRAMGKKKPEEMEKQKKIFISGALNVNQLEREKELNDTLGVNLELDLRGFDFLDDYIDDKGHFSDSDKLDKFIKDFIGLSDQEVDYLGYQINNDKLVFDDLIEEFKNKMYPKIKKSVENYLGENDTPSAKELSTSIYFSIFEHVRYANIFNVIDKFAGYGFNKSHSLAYAFVSYQTGYLKANYPKEFFAAVLSNTSDIEKLSSIVYDMEHNSKITLKNPSVNESDYLYKPLIDSNEISFGLQNIKSLGKFGKSIELERKKNGNYKSLQDLILRVHYRNIIDGEDRKDLPSGKLSSGAFNALVYSGSLDCFLQGDKLSVMSQRESLIREYDSIMIGYPKESEVIVNLVENRLKDGVYSDVIIDELEQYNRIQNSLIKKVGYEVKFENLIPVDFKYDPNSIAGKELNFSKIDDFLLKLKEKQKVYATELKQLKLNIKQNKISESVSDIESRISKINDFELFLKLSNKGKYKLKTKKDIDGYKSSLNNFMEVVSNDKELYKSFMDVGVYIFGDSFLDQGFPSVLESCYYYEKHKKSKSKNKGELIPLSLSELNSMYSSKEVKPIYKAKRCIQVLKKRCPELIKQIAADNKKTNSYTPSEILTKELNYTGLFLTMHPVNLNNAKEKTLANYSSVQTVNYLERLSNDIDLLESKSGETIYVAAALTNVIEKTTRNGGKMYIATLSDESGDYEAVMFNPLSDEMEKYMVAGTVGTFAVQLGIHNERPSMVINEAKLHSPDIERVFGKYVRPQYSQAKRE